MRAFLIASAAMAALAACVQTPGTAGLDVDPTLSMCATAEQAAEVTAYLENRPGIPLAIASRNLEIPEAAAASALPADTAVGVVATPEIASKVWDTVEAWGEYSKVGLVFSPSGQHAFALPSLVPMRVDPDSDGYLDVYADDGDGVHSHIQLKYVSAIYATDIKAPSGDRTRALIYYGPDGHAIIGVYPSIKGDVYSEAAVTGFKATWDLLAAMPQPCE
ncbi:MAG: hypothetical protein MRY64_14960 [Hyphomonadaceae bacterium]|nr:hypothetical protein [Hyphomonadaceae bacterium]